MNTTTRVVGLAIFATVAIVWFLENGASLAAQSGGGAKQSNPRPFQAAGSVQSGGNSVVVPLQFTVPADGRLKIERLSVRAIDPSGGNGAAYAALSTTVSGVLGNFYLPLQKSPAASGVADIGLSDFLEIYADASTLVRVTVFASNTADAPVNATVSGTVIP
jgi:hypothetical protein